MGQQTPGLSGAFEIRDPDQIREPGQRELDLPLIWVDVIIAVDQLLREPGRVARAQDGS